MKKFKNILLSVAATSAVIAPVATAMSCNPGGNGSSESWTGKNDGKYSILTSLSASSPQHGALEKAVKAWNDLPENASKQFEITDVEGGYSAIPGQLSAEFEAKDTVKMPNLILDYPDSVGVIAKYDAQLNLDDEAGTIKALFDTQFTSINDQIGGVKEAGLYAVPIAKSVDMASYDAPVFKHIIEVARSKKLFAASNPQTTKVVDAILDKANGDTDKAAVAAIWTPSNVTTEYAGTPFDDSILTDSGKMLDFVTEAMKYFEKSKNPNGAILGIDSATNFMYSSLFQIANGDFNKFLFSKGDDGYIKYNWDDKESEAYKNFVKVYSKLQKAIDAGAVYVNTGGAYSSSLETQHQIAFAFGSTAGYFHNYVAAPVTAKGEDGKDVVLTTNTDRLNFTDPANTAKAGQIGTFSSYDNFISLSTDTNYKAPANENTADHNIQLKDAATDKAVKDFIAANSSKTIFVSSASNISKVRAADKVELKIDETRKSNSSFVKNPKFLVVADAKGAEKSLQVDELVVKPVPTQFDGSSKAVLVQGPSLIGIHNADEDVVVKEFVKWFMTGTVQDKDKNNVTPAEAFAKSAQYILPTKTSLAKISTTKANDKITIDSLKSITNGVKAFDNPADDTTGNFRNILQTTIASQYTNVVNNGHAAPAEEIYTSVSRSFK